MMKLNYLQMRALQRAIEVINDSLNVRIGDMGLCIDDESVVFGVNWSCKGISKYQDAEQYGKNLIKAARIAQALNFLEVSYTYEDIEDSKKCSQEIFEKSVGRIAHELEYPDFPEFIQAAINKVGR